VNISLDHRVDESAEIREAEEQEEKQDQDENLRPVREERRQAAPSSKRKEGPNADPALSDWRRRKERLLAFLDVHDNFPERFREQVYRQLLRLPRNEQAFNTLVNMGLHPLATSQLQAYHLSDSRLRQRLSRVVHVLANWCEALACSSFLPSFAFPWVKFFGRDDCLAAETCIMFFLNWAHNWFQFWPSPPVHLLANLERLLFAKDSQLFRHLDKLGLTPQDYMWPLLRSVFSEVLDRNSWLHIMDHILIKPTSFIYCVLIALLVHSRAAIMSLKSPSQMNLFLTRANPVDAKAVVRSAVLIAGDLRFARTLRQMQSMVGEEEEDREDRERVFLENRGGGAYPLLANFPKASVGHLASLFEKVREEEETYLQQKKDGSRDRTAEEEADGARRETRPRA